MTNILWFFDFISPFAYLQAERLGDLTASVTPKPVLFAGLLKHWGHLGPAEIPAKRLFTYRHVLWLAQKHGIPMKLPPAHPFNPLKLLRLCLACENRLEAVSAIFRFVWRDGGDVENPAQLAALAHRLGAEPFPDCLQDPHVKRQLIQNGEDAKALGLFGVPSLVIDGELFWGFDATEMVGDYLADPNLLSRGEMARVNALPIGTARPK